MLIALVVLSLLLNVLALTFCIRAFFWIRVSARLGTPIAFRDTRSLIEVWEILTHGQSA